MLSVQLLLGLATAPPMILNRSSDWKSFLKKKKNQTHYQGVFKDSKITETIVHDNIRFLEYKIIRMIHDEE